MKKELPTIKSPNKKGFQLVEAHLYTVQAWYLFSIHQIFSKICFIK